MNEMDIIHQLMRMLYLYKKETVMEKKHQSELSRRDLMLLEVIRHMNQCHPVKMSDISHYLDITPAAVSQSVRDFEKKGWVKRVTPENDRRSVYVNITADAILSQIRRNLLAPVFPSRLQISAVKNIDIFLQSVCIYDARTDMQSPCNPGYPFPIR